MSFDNKYFENDSVWDADRVFKSTQEIERFDVTRKCIPADVKSIMDVGCGNGAFMRYIEDGFSGVLIQGLENSTVAIANKVSKSEIVQSSIEDMPFDDREFDLVSALEVLEHLSYKGFDVARGQMERVASKYILISVPYNEKRVFATCPQCSCRFSPIYHLRSFDDSMLAELFDGFSLVKKEYVYIDSIFFAEPLRKLNYEKRIKWEGELQCPQCGYSDEGHVKSKTSHIERNNPAYIEFIKKMIPKKKRPHWVVCLYERK